MAALDVNKILRIAFFDENKVFIERTALITTDAKRIFTTPKNCRYILLQVYLQDALPTKILVNEDTSLTIDDYEPYGYKVPIVINGTTTNIYLSEPLRKLGDYADYIDFENQEVVRSIKETKLSSSMSIETYITTKIRMFITNIRSVTSFVGLKSNRFQSSTKTSWGKANEYEVVTQGSQNTPAVCVTFPVDTEINTVELFKQWVDENETLVYYPIQTPTTEKITLPDIAIPKGNSVITTDTEIKPSDMYGKVIV